MQGPHSSESLKAGDPAIAPLPPLWDSRLIALAIVDPTGRWTDLNDRLCTLIGRSREELRGRRVDDSVHPEDAPAADALARTPPDGAGRPERTTLRFGKQGGDWVSAEVESMPIGPSLRVWVVKEMDRHVDAASKDSAAGQTETYPRDDALIRLLLHGAPLPMGIVEVHEDADDILHIFDNPAACRSLGLKAGTTAGRWDGEDFAVPRATRRTWIEAYRASRRLGHSVHFEDCHVHEGRDRWLGVVVTHVGPGPGGRDRFVYIAEDITERKRTEEEILQLNRSLQRQADELRTVLEVLPVAVGIGDDPTCRSIRPNPMLVRMLRAESGGNVSLTAPDSERTIAYQVYFEGREVPGQELPMQLCASTGVPIRDQEYEIRFQDGEEIRILAYVAPLFEEQGEPRGCVGVFLDVTERRKAEREREALLEELREADVRKDEFLAMLAHELRSPLSAIGNAAQILQFEPTEASVLPWSAGVIHRQTRQLGRLLDDLLDVSRIRRGKLRLRREVVDLRDVVQRAVETARPAIEAKQHRVELELPAEPLTADVDAGRIEQTIVNLIANAAKYSEEGRTISVAVAREGDEIAAAVKDEGVGMAPDVLERIFEPFSQAESSLGHSQGGLGVGLTIARSLTELHGGALTAASEGPGRGSLFVLRLPAATREIRQSPDEVAARDSAVISRSAGRRVLVVDDNEDAARSLAHLLESLGHASTAVFDGETAVKVAADFGPDVAILDIGLPEMDGYELARRLRASRGREKLVLVALTGFGRDEDRRRAMASGFDHHLTKPADLDSVLALLASG